MEVESAYMAERLSVPPSVFYDNPTLPTAFERGEWIKCPVTPHEAHLILVNSISNRRSLSAKEERALVDIIEGGVERNLFEMLPEEEEEI